MISWDRSDEYIKGATQGAPQAVHVADRFHLLGNLREALMRANPEGRSVKTIRYGGMPPPKPPDDE